MSLPPAPVNPVAATAGKIGNGSGSQVRRGRYGEQGEYMSGVDPYAYLQQVSVSMDRLQDRDQIETVLDEVEYLFEVIPPELQDLAEPIIQELRKRLAECR